MPNNIALITGRHVIQPEEKMFGPASLSQDYEFIPFHKEGWTPLLIPAVRFSDAEVSEMITIASLVVLTGGEDVDPLLYHEDVRYPEVKRSEFRDAVEISLLKEVMKKKKPVLCICRGAQILNVCLGGTLYQDIPKDIPGALSHMQKENESLSHTITIEGGSFLEKVYSGKEITVNSFHHQAIKGIGKDLRVTARASDGVIEAVEHETLPIIGVQWHPEISYAFDDASKILFQALKILSRLKK